MINTTNKLIIDLAALVHNYNQIRGLTGKETRIMGVVKADAYGHGLVAVSQTLEKNSIDCLGVAYVDEAIELRKNGIKIPIIALCGMQTTQEAQAAVEYDVKPVVYDIPSAEMLSREGGLRGKTVDIHLKVDTGMGRLGISRGEITPFLHQISAMGSLNVEALMSHLSCADAPGDGFTAKQIKHFQEAVGAGRAMGFALPLNSLANSAGIMAHEEARCEMVRPGIALYGGRPSPDFPCPIPLKPVMHFKGRVLQIRDLPDGTPVGYGRTFYTAGRRRIAILSAGYAEGLPRGMSNTGHVLIQGKRAPLVGRVSMNLTAADITGIPDVEKGDEVVFLGAQGGQTLTADDMARSAGAISYEIFCSIGLRNNKEYQT